MKISVIMPIFNCEAYVEQSIRSVLSQTLKELEVICIDDGSTDASPQLVEKLQAVDSRIVLLKQNNQGAGAARNFGLKKARGKYIAFLDADDYYVDHTALESMFEACEAQEVPLCVSRQMYMIDRDKEYVKELFSKEASNHVLQYRDYQGDYDYMSYLFLRNMLLENNIRFPLYRRFQDPPFFVQASFTAEKFAVLDTCLYGYRLPDVAARYNMDKACDLLRGLIDNLNFARKQGLDRLFRNTVERLEYEFAYIIYKNISANDLRILKLLMKANQIINDAYGLTDYIIRPIRMIAFCGIREERLLQKIATEEKTVLYGAGKRTKIFLTYLKEKNLFKKITAIAVSDLKGNTSQIEGIPVVSASEFLKKRDSFLIVTVRREIAVEIEMYLIQNGYTNYELLEDDFGDDLTRHRVSDLR